MKSLFVITLLSAYVCLVYSAATAEFSSKVKATGQKCKAEHKVDDETYTDFVVNHKIPDSENAKCMMNCFMKDMGYFHDGKFDIEAMEESNKHKWSEAEQVEKANGVTKHCVEEVGTEEKNECELAHKIVTCFFHKVKEAGLSVPELHH